MNKTLFILFFLVIFSSSMQNAQQKQLTTWDSKEISALFNKCTELNPGQGLGQVISLAISNKGDTVAAGYANGNVLLWNISDKNQPIWRARYILEDKSINSICFSKDDKYILTGSATGNVILYDITNYNYNQNPIYKLLANKMQSIKNVSISSDSKYAIAVNDNTLIFYEFKKPNDLTNSECFIHEKNWNLNLGIFSPDNRYILLAFLNQVGIYKLKSFLYSFDPNRKQEEAIELNKFNTTLDEKNVVSASISISGDRILTACANGSAAIWDVSDLYWNDYSNSIGHREFEPSTTYSKAKSIAISVDGRYCLTADNKTLLWDFESFRFNQLQKSKELKADNISADNNKGPVIFSYDGKYALSIAGDWNKNQVVRLWYSEETVAQNLPIISKNNFEQEPKKYWDFQKYCPICIATAPIYVDLANYMYVTRKNCKKCNKIFYWCGVCEKYTGEIQHNCKQIIKK